MKKCDPPRSKDYFPEKEENINEKLRIVPFFALIVP